jgi:hypothetical protein
MKRLYVHIGLPKTGTTAIQYFLHENRASLKRAGYLYPGKETAHHCLGWRMAGMKGWLASEEAAIEDSRKIFREINESNSANVIVSSETMSEGLIDHAGRLRAILGEELLSAWEIKIIVYIRRQDHWLESWYMEVVGSKDPPANSDTFPEFLLHYREYVQIDYETFLRPWSELFGRENIIVRIYEKEQQPQGIIQDFLSVIGVSPDGNFRSTASEFINLGLSHDAVEIIRLCNRERDFDPAFRLFLRRHLVRVSPKVPYLPYSYLTPKERYDLVKTYDASNSLVAREYLGRAEGILFYEEQPDPNAQQATYGGLSLEAFIPVAMKLQYDLTDNLDGRLRNFENPLRGIAKLVKKLVRP